jgi:hypothetical protein
MEPGNVRRAKIPLTTVTLILLKADILRICFLLLLEMQKDNVVDGSERTGANEKRIGSVRLLFGAKSASNEAPEEKGTAILKSFVLLWFYKLDAFMWCPIERIRGEILPEEKLDGKSGFLDHPALARILDAIIFSATLGLCLWLGQVNGPTCTVEECLHILMSSGEPYQSIPIAPLLSGR